MTGEEFHKLLTEELKMIPKSFHPIIDDIDWDRGESYHNKWIRSEELIAKIVNAIKGMNQ